MEISKSSILSMGKRKQKSSRSAPPKQPRSSGDLPFQLFSTRDEEQEFKSFRLAHQDRAESASSSGLNTHTTDHEEPPPAASDDEPGAADDLGEHGSPGMKWQVVSYPETSHSAVWTSRLEERLTRAVDRACSIAPVHNLPRKAIERLRSGTWLCDDLVDHFIQNPIIPWDGIWSWNKGQISACIDTAKRILIPTNLNSHWLLLSIDLSTRRLRILDSLKSRHRSSDENIQEEKMRLIGAMTMFVVKLGEKLGGPFLGARAWKFEENETGNMHDCGVYTIFYARHLQTGDTVNHKKIIDAFRIPSNCPNVDFLRMQLAWELLKGQD
ncbi:hypothetical protein D9615_010339 [Tricholomella constricta]|uniref:Ubiquitin-like protease family profile domain-containing protein n=1 Tax=Tricholomella constricta TaxID=117010 RepID=A0A8H5LV08_9AGAR|nr:hypothetical protein D9615_010339 [Tricholomella constricta]